MSFINEEEETFEFVTLKGTSINDADTDNFEYSSIFNDKMLEETFNHTFPNVDYNSLNKKNDNINYEISIFEISIYDKVNKCKYIYNNRGWSKVNILC